jgi:hypothetical protein
MIYIVFKNKEPLGFKKLRYAKVLARAIKELFWLKKIIKHEDLRIEIDYKIIFK